ncbi:hypothetical protein EJB05_52030, partial [Eragrostis curvula]
MSVCQHELNPRALTSHVTAGCWPHAHFRFLAEQEHEDQTPRSAEMSRHTSSSASVSDHGKRAKRWTRWKPAQETNDIAKAHDRQAAGLTRTSGSSPSRSKRPKRRAPRR